MKKSKQKGKDGRGGARPGSGRGCRWKHGRTKLVRLPVALLDRILQVARYMDENDGKLPYSTVPVVSFEGLSKNSAWEELEEILAKRKADELLGQVMSGDE
jgi:hypothetical protein